MPKNPVVDKSGNKCWYNSKGKLHREDGPAIEWAYGYKVWYVNGKRHREDGPAVEWADGDKEWWINGKLHREDRPAIEYTDGYKAWYIKDKRHREDGPAMECADGHKEWWIDGEELTEKEFFAWKKSQEPVDISNYLEDLPDLHIQT